MEYNRSLTAPLSILFFFGIALSILLVPSITLFYTLNKHFTSLIAPLYVYV